MSSGTESEPSLSPIDEVHEIREENHLGFYTYDDEEPETIPITPVAWNKYSMDITNSDLIAFLVGKEVHQELADTEVGEEFAAHAPQHSPRIQYPGPSRATLRN